MTKEQLESKLQDLNKRLSEIKWRIEYHQKLLDGMNDDKEFVLEMIQKYKEELEYEYLVLSNDNSI